MVGRCIVFLSFLPVLAAQEPALLQVRVVEGEGVVYLIGSRATRGITVQVTDETNRPVESASVGFRLPEDGPGGTFATGARTEIATTRADGRATVWGMQWNRTVGSFEIRITAVKGQTRAGTVCSQFLSDALASRAAAPSRVHLGLGRGHKWLWITLATAGVAVGGAAAAGLARGSGQGSPSPPSGVLQIGTPVINLGHP